MFSILLSCRRARLLASLVVVGGLVLGLAATQSAAEPTTAGFSSFFRVGGRVAHPKVYRLADLKALPAHTVAVSFQGPGGTQTHAFTGALTDDVATAAAPRVDADQKNDILRWTARVHARTTTRSSSPGVSSTRVSRPSKSCSRMPTTGSF